MLPLSPSPQVSPQVSPKSRKPRSTGPYKATMLHPASMPRDVLSEASRQVISLAVLDNLLATTNNNGFVYVWDLAAHELILTIKCSPFKLVWSPDGTLLGAAVVSSQSGSSLHIFDIKTGLVIIS